MSKNTNALSAGRPSARTDRKTTLASLSDTASMKRVNFDISAENHAKLKIYAAQQGKSIKEILSEFVEQLPI
ncbi:TPA: chromosome partitioning protein ParB [Yersinia enterocolitica]|uniref:plasmid partition protein ParG n=1 Tax=Yersinia massiliensis TaxID=419257 RepID=UPI001561F471|nr:plasmid partition protein ParG [Yersinia massiliensis]QKJ09288.1 chromosome partitioning protein ParB [Yersinia massiliensis]HDX9051778.1 chromosome partitioning protein ParB [Yersinia enterocolitica]